MNDVDREFSDRLAKLEVGQAVMQTDIKYIREHLLQNVVRERFGLTTVIAVLAVIVAAGSYFT